MRSECDLIRLEVADTWIKRMRGLLGVHTLSDKQALWFRPCNAVHTFGMRFDLSVFFVDRKTRIIKVHPRVPPGRLLVCVGAHSVVEMIALQQHQSLDRQIERVKAALWNTGNRTSITHPVL